MEVCEGAESVIVAARALAQSHVWSTVVLASLGQERWRGVRRRSAALAGQLASSPSVIKRGDISLHMRGKQQSQHDFRLAFQRCDKACSCNSRQGRSVDTRRRSDWRRMPAES